MSIAEFSAALRNKGIKEWFNKEKGLRESQRAENINTLVNATSMYRSAEETAAKNSFIITKDTVRDLLSSIRGYSGDELDTATNIAFAAFASKNTGVRVNRRKLNVGNGIPAVYFNSISFDSITTLVNNILNLSAGELAREYEKGHVVGLNTELLRITANRISEIDARVAQGTSNAKNVILKELDNVIEYYKKLDYDSANIQPASDVKVYASVNKTINKTGKTKYLVELQPKAANQASAKEVKATIGSIRKLFDPGALTDKAIVKLLDSLIPKVSDPKFAQDLLNLKSSPSFLDMIGTQIANTIIGKSVDQDYSHPNVLIGTQKVPKVNLTEVRKLAKQEILKANALKAKLNTKAPPIVRTTKSQTYTLASLQVLINTHLQDVISANMGMGTDRNILNYRTGRFAASAKVEKMSQSREGMITAFYSYMKNPYQTFEPGYRQGSPKTRDPKLLISSSIRDIAATKVANRLRAVVI